MMRRVLLALLALAQHVCSSSFASGASVPVSQLLSHEGRKTNSQSAKEYGNNDVLVLDVDGTLYDADCGVEAQIVAGIYRFAWETAGVSPAQCEDLHRRYGSTLRGLEQERLIDDAQRLQFYRQVYYNVDLSRLRRSGSLNACTGGAADASVTGSGDGTGYRHAVDWSALLRAWAGAKYLASNSPRCHVERVVAALGLADVPWDGVLCPDNRGGLTKSDPEFYLPLLEAHPLTPPRSQASSETLPAHRIFLVDDSAHNCAVAAAAGMEAVRVSPAFPVDRALAALVGAIPMPDLWTFSEADYLRAKNQVDEASRNPAVWAALEEQVRCLAPADGTLRVLDLGAGLLPLLRPVLGLRGAFWRVEYVAFETAASVIAAAAEELNALGFAALPPPPPRPPRASSDGGGNGNDEFVADGGWGGMEGGGSWSSGGGDGGGSKYAAETAYYRAAIPEDGTPAVVVVLRQQDFTSPAAASDIFPLRIPPVFDDNAGAAVLAAFSGGGAAVAPPSGWPPESPVWPPGPATDHHGAAASGQTPQGPDLILGECLVDLLHPDTLVAALDRLAGESGALVYLPITFAGRTACVPAAPQEGVVPADDEVLEEYARDLVESQGHFVEPERLLQAIRAHGGSVLACGLSDWVVRRADAPVLWDSLLYFFGVSVAPRLAAAAAAGAATRAATAAAVPAGAAGAGMAGAEMAGANVKEPSSRGGGFSAWVSRVRDRSPTFVASNVDILARTVRRAPPPTGLVYGDIAPRPPLACAADHHPASARDVRGGGTSTPAVAAPAVGWDTTPAAAPGAAGDAAIARILAPTTAGKDSAIGDTVGSTPPSLLEHQTPSPTAQPMLLPPATPRPPSRPLTPISSPPYSNSFLEFVAPRRVEVRSETLAAAAVGPRQVAIAAYCSSVSTGTELKVFRGEFGDGSAALDTTIPDMAGQTMTYPMRYGYSLVGRVVHCGAEVERPEGLLGRLVFAFSPHASVVVVDYDSVMLVPEGIAAEDAIYVPAVETALSLVQDACPRVGERVAVFGQGMIGLLVTAILSRGHGNVGVGSVTAVDILPARRAAALRAGATRACDPTALAAEGDDNAFDVCVEVSGSPRGLQSAVDRAGYGGRVVLGSWYGAAPATLRLGLDFHRSHVTLQASQVSRVAAALSDRWDKARRFRAAWTLVRALRPSRLLTTAAVPLAEAQRAYEALDAGAELGVQISYGDGGGSNGSCGGNGGGNGGGGADGGGNRLGGGGSGGGSAGNGIGDGKSSIAAREMTEATAGEADREGKRARAEAAMMTEQ